MQPEVSVVMPTRDRSELLAASLASVLAQRDIDLEVIVVDDGSTDATPAYLRSVVDDRLVVVRHPVATGVSRARNDGWECARAPWVAFTDDDDLWAPDKLRSQLDALAARPGAGWCSSGAVVIDDDGRLIGQRDPWRADNLDDTLLVRNVIAGGASGVVVDRDLVERVGGFDPELSVLADWDLWTRLALVAPAAVVDRPLHAYRIHARGMSTTSTDVRPELDRIDHKYADERRRRGLVLSRASIELWMGDRHHRAGRRLQAARCYLWGVPHISRRRSLAKTAEVLVWPGLQRVRNWVHGRRMSDGWRAEVNRWLPDGLARSQPSGSSLELVGGSGAGGLVSSASASDRQAR